MKTKKTITLLLTLTLPMSACGKGMDFHTVDAAVKQSSTDCDSLPTPEEKSACKDGSANVNSWISAYCPKVTIACKEFGYSSAKADCTKDHPDQMEACVKGVDFMIAILGH